MKIDQSLMKIDRSLRDVYNQYRPQYETLETEVRDRVANIIHEQKKTKNQNWFFSSRVKSLESFALKIETGQVKDPSKMDDFFACTVIVPTLKQINDAKKVIFKSFKRHNRRPKFNIKTDKRSSDFVFDDLRIYASLHPNPSGKYPYLSGVVFEIQIKTTLQHAWSDVTHDLIYKATEISWPRERIAFQLKAMLEHADLVIEEAAQLEKAFSIAKQDVRTANIENLIGQINRIWHRKQLPNDVRRLAKTIHEVLSIAGFTASDFSRIINAEKLRCGKLLDDLSPYAFTVQALSNLSCINFKDKLDQKDVRTHIVVHNNMDLPKWMNPCHPKIIVLE